MHMWPAKRGGHTFIAISAQLCWEEQTDLQWIVGPHGVSKAVRGPHVNRPLSWDDEAVQFL